jgi:putative nucleotidyltransferase with HDIG domain
VALTALDYGHRARPRAILLAVAVVGISVAHYSLGVATHGFHVIHIILAASYLVPITAASVWFGLRGSVLTTSIISVAYYAHTRLSWPNQPMENANQMAMIGVFWLLGIVAGVLEDLQARERKHRLEAEKRAEREAAIEAITGLSNALRARDEYTREHSEHVAMLAVAIGRKRGLSPEQLEMLRLAALVHDVGKIGIRDDILLKPDHLTADERERIEQHPMIAAKILRPIHSAREISQIVLAHHEHPDGTGYPQGLTAAQIPLEAHILRVADVYASLTEQRPYKSAMPSELALQIMETWSGTKLQAESFRTLRAVLDDRLTFTMLDAQAPSS